LYIFLVFFLSSGVEDGSAKEGWEAWGSALYIYICPVLCILSFLTIFGVSEALVLMCIRIG
jgi:hypothetical protein